VGLNAQERRVDPNGGMKLQQKIAIQETSSLNNEMFRGGSKAVIYEEGFEGTTDTETGTACSTPYFCGG
jgi:hypothetical protein